MEVLNTSRQFFNLDKQSLDSFTLLIHGGRASGKTHLGGDALRYEQQYGKVRFINVKGEDGALTVNGMGLGEAGETVESYEDFLAACKEFSQNKLQACFVDSLHPLNKWVQRKVTGGADRLPRITKDSNEWGELHREMDNAMMYLRSTAKYVICSCPSDKSVDQLTGITYITPDLPGREAVGSAGWFDFVGYLEASVVGPGKVQRTFNMVPNSQVIVRQRLPRQVTQLIKLPDGPGGWKLIKDTLLAAMAPVANTAKA